MQGSLFGLNNAAKLAKPNNMVRFAGKKPDMIQCDTGVPYSRLTQGLLTPRKHQVRLEHAVLSTLLGAKTYSRNEAEDILTRSIPHDYQVTSRIRNFDRLFRGLRYEQDTPARPEPDEETPKLIKKLKELGKKAADKVIRTDKVTPLPEPTKADFRENYFLIDALQHGYANTPDGADRLLLMGNLMRLKPEGKTVSVNNWLEAVVADDIANFVNLHQLDPEESALYTETLTKQFVALYQDPTNEELQSPLEKNLKALELLKNQPALQNDDLLAQQIKSSDKSLVIGTFLGKMAITKNLITQTQQILRRIHPTDPVVIKKNKSKIPNDFYKGARFYWDKDLA